MVSVRAGKGPSSGGKARESARALMTGAMFCGVCVMLMPCDERRAWVPL